MIQPWKFVFADTRVENDFLNSPKKICIAAHSTPYFDGIILYNALKTMGEEDPCLYARGFSPYCSAIQIPGNGGFVKSEISLLQNASTFCRIIFPSGGKIIWKTGFYVLAQQLQAKIVILGIDYRHKLLVVDSIIDPNDTFERTKDICIERLRKYAPGPFCYFLRVLCNYGCETHIYSNFAIKCGRVMIICFLLLFYKYICYFSISDPKTPKQMVGLLMILTFLFCQKMSRGGES